MGDGSGGGVFRRLRRGRTFPWVPFVVLLVFGVGCSGGDAVVASVSTEEDVSDSTVEGVAGSTIGDVSGSSFKGSVDLHKAAIAACMSKQGFDIENPSDSGYDEENGSFVGGIREAQTWTGEELPEIEESEEFVAFLEAFAGPDDSEQDFWGGCIGVVADQSGVTDEDLELFDKLWEENDVYSLTEKERVCLIDLVDDVDIDVESLSDKQLWDEAESVGWQADSAANQELIEALAEAVEPGLSSSLSSDFEFGDGVYSGSAFVGFLEPRGFLPLSEMKLAELETIESSLGHRPFGTLYEPCDIDFLRVVIFGALQQNPEYHDAAALTAAFFELAEDLE